MGLFSYNVKLLFLNQLFSYKKYFYTKNCNELEDLTLDNSDVVDNATLVEAY